MTTRKIDIEPLIEDEWYTVRYSGEIPEVALYSALYHLSEDPGGPRLVLSNEQRNLLLEGARQRYLEITLRDLLPENMNTSGYRGIKRSFINWQRYLLFCDRHGLDGSVYKSSVAATLVDLLNSERAIIAIEDSGTIFNCSLEELTLFMKLLGLEPAALPASVKNYCSDG